MIKRLLLLLPLLFSSCVAYHYGDMSHAGYPDPRFETSGKAYAQVSTTRILFLGGLGTDGMLMEAQQKLHDLHPLKEGEYFINYTYDYKHKFFLFGDRTELTLSADVIRDRSIAVSNSNFDPVKDLRNGDPIYLLNATSRGTVKKAIFINYDGDTQKDTVGVEFIWANERPRFKKKTMPLGFLFFTQMTENDIALHKLKIGQEIKNFRQRDWIIVAYSRGQFILENKEGELVRVRAGEIGNK